MSASKLYSVYAVRHVASGRYYFGQTHRSLTDRWKAHCAAARLKKAVPEFVQAIRDHGQEAFEVIPLLSGLTESEAKSWERELIARHEARGERTYNHCWTERERDAGRRRWSEVANDAEYRKRNREHLQRIAKDPAVSERRKAAARAVWAGLTPEQRAERGRKMREGWKGRTA